MIIIIIRDLRHMGYASDLRNYHIIHRKRTKGVTWIRVEIIVLHAASDRMHSTHREMTPGWIIPMSMITD